MLAESAEIGRTAQYAPVRLARPAATGAIFETTIAGADATTTKETATMGIRLRDLDLLHRRRVDPHQALSRAAEKSP